MLRMSIILLLSPCFLQAQNNTVDFLIPNGESYDHFMKLEEPDADQVDSIIRLSISYSYIDKDTCLLLGIRSVEESRNMADRTIKAKALVELGDSYRIFGLLGEGEKLLIEGKKIYEEIGDEGQVATANNKLGALQVNQGNYDIAIDYYLDALATWERLKDSQNIIKPYINIGAVFKNLNQNVKAEEYYDKALEWAAILDDDRARMYVYNNQAIIYNSIIADYQSRILRDTSLETTLKDSILQYSEKAITKYENALDVARKKEDKRSIVQFLSNLVGLKNTIGEYNQAVILANEAEGMVENIGSATTNVQLRINQAEAFRQLGEFKTSINYGEQALKLAKDNSLGKFEASANQQLYQTYKLIGNFQTALFNLEEMNFFQQRNNDSIRNNAIAEVEAKFQNVQKQKQILEQEKNILELESSKAKIEKQRNTIIGGGMFTGLLMLMGFRFNKVRKERNDKREFAEALIYAQEEERKRIARDLHDGIGQSLLLIKKQMETTESYTRENKRLIAETLEEVRAISRDLHPFQLEKFGLTAVINDIIDKVENSTDLFVTREVEPIDGVFDVKQEINVFRTVQEALTNIVKHADASAVKVEIKSNAAETTLKIMDNGKGIDQELVANTKSLGLKTMQERITSLHGSFNIKSDKNEGTSIEITIPRK